MYRIMIVDDEPFVLTALMRSIKNDKEINIDIFEDVSKALVRAQSLNYDLFISDYRMPEMDGVEFLTQIKQIQPDSMRIILSGYADIKVLLAAINEANIFRFITKPWDNEHLNESIKQALDYRDIMVENKRLADQVRNQSIELNRHKTAIEKIEEQYPGLTKVNWDEDGSISLLLDENSDT